MKNASNDYARSPVECGSASLYHRDVPAGWNPLRRVPNSPRIPALAAFVLATLFVVVRLLSVGNGDVGSFVGAGDLLSSGTDLPLQTGAGYDGQFYYRMALEPLDFDKTTAGVTIDSEMRLQRIGYPAATWLLSLGGLISVEYALIAVNLLGLALIAGIGGVFAQRSGRHALWGLMLTAFYGFAFTLSKDLTEIVEVTFLLLGLVAARKQRFAVAALALGGAVLTRESALFIVPFIAVWRLYVIVRRRERPNAIDLTWIVPPLMFGAWQLIVHASTGRFPVRAERDNTVNFPGWPLLRTLPDLFDDLTVRGLVHLAEVVVLVAVLLIASISLHKSTAEPLEVAVFAGLAIACLAVDVRSNVWTIRSLRMFADAYVLAMVVLLATQQRLAVLGAAVGAVSVTTYGHFVFNL